MISEAAITGKPIYTIKLKNIKNDYRFQRFFKLFQELGIIRFFDGSIDNWTYEKLYESKRISNNIIKK
jgi:mitochondrial fission protein ELM1